MDAERLERAARAAATLAYDMGNEDGRNPAKGLGATLDAAVVRTMHIDRAVAAALAAPEPAPATGDVHTWERPSRVWVVAWPNARSAHFTEEARDHAAEPMPNGSAPVMTEYVPSSVKPAQAGGGDACCLFCRTELDPDEMDDGSDLPPLAPGVCSECFQRWHDEPVWRKRLKEATDKPAQAGEDAETVLLMDVLDALVECTDSANIPRHENLAAMVRVQVDRRIRSRAAPSRPVGASQSAPDAALLERVARETVHLCLDLYDNCINVRRDRDGLIARAIAAAKGGA